MRINILQHSPNEGPGFIKDWALERGHDIYVYPPYYFDGILPNEKDTDMLIILGGPMSPNDDLPWIKDERKLIQELIDRSIPNNVTHHSSPRTFSDSSRSERLK